MSLYISVEAIYLYIPKVQDVDPVCIGGWLMGAGVAAEAQLLPHTPLGSVTSVTQMEHCAHLLFHKTSQVPGFSAQQYYLFMLLQVGKPPGARGAHSWWLFRVACNSFC